MTIYSSLTFRGNRDEWSGGIQTFAIASQSLVGGLGELKTPDSPMN